MSVLQWLCACTVHCQRVTELDERYNSCRAKVADCVAAAVKRKEEVCHMSNLWILYISA